jgi:hypothetical protein
MDDRIPNFVKTVQQIFNLEGNDVETIAEWWEIWWELVGIEATILEQSKTFSRTKYTKCPYKTEPKDINNWCKLFGNIVTKTLNPKATLERHKGMCAGDSHCEFLLKIEE